MLYKAIIIVFAAALAGVALPSAASAFGGHGGGGFGFYGFGYPYGYYGYPYGYGAYYGGDVNCYVVRKRIHTAQGWRIRRVEVCE